MMCWSIDPMGLSTVSVFSLVSLVLVSSSRQLIQYLHLDVPEIHTQLLHERRLAFVSFCAERRDPACAQTAFGAHAPAHASRCPEAIPAASRAAVALAVAGARRRRAERAALRLEGRCVARDGLPGVGRRVELQVLWVCVGGAGAGCAVGRGLGRGLIVVRHIRIELSVRRVDQERIA